MNGDEVTQRPLRVEMLKEDDTFILELYDQVYVWQGKNASTKELHMSVTIANNYKKKWNKPKGTEIHRIRSGCEDAVFPSFFSGWWAKKNQNIEIDAGMDKDFIDTKVKAKQDMNLIANQHLKAAALLQTQLGSNYKIDVYHVSDDFK